MDGVGKDADNLARYSKSAEQPSFIGWSLRNLTNQTKVFKLLLFPANKIKNKNWFPANKIK